MATADAIDEFALRRIEADAEKLMLTDAAGAHLALAKVAALRWDVDEMTRRHELAITLRDSAFSRCDYSDSLTLIGEIDEAFEVAREASSRAPDDLDVLRQAIKSAVQDARFREAQKLCNRWSKLSPQEPMPLQPTSRRWSRLSSEAYSPRPVLATPCGRHRDSGAMRTSDAAAFSIQPSIEDPGSFGFEYDLIASPAEAGDLNNALARRWGGFTPAPRRSWPRIRAGVYRDSGSPRRGSPHRPLPDPARPSSSGGSPARPEVPGGVVVGI